MGAAETTGLIAAGASDAPDTDPWARLIAGIAERDQASLSELYRLTVAKLVGMARRILKDPADVEEVVCDSYLHAWHTAAQYEPARGSVLAWLMIICRNRAIDRLRNNGAGMRGAACGAEPAAQPGIEVTPLDLLLALERDHAVHRAVAELSPLRRELLALAFFRGLTHPEIAADTRLALGTVKSHLRRAMSALRKRLPVGGSGERDEEF
jgi:RNA polymerase sigma-70 factor (ECF subfamily)